MIAVEGKPADQGPHVIDRDTNLWTKAATIPMAGVLDLA